MPYQATDPAFFLTYWKGYDFSILSLYFITKRSFAAKGKRQPFALEIKKAFDRGLAVRISCQTRKAVL